MMYAFIMICFQRVESMQKQLDSSLKEVEGLKEARERQTQMVSAINAIFVEAPVKFISSIMVLTFSPFSAGWGSY